MKSEIFKVTKEKFGYYLTGNKSSLDKFHTSENHKKFWRKFANKTININQFEIDTFPNVGDGYFDTDYAVPKNYKYLNEYK